MTWWWDAPWNGGEKKCPIRPLRISVMLKEYLDMWCEQEQQCENATLGTHMQQRRHLHHRPPKRLHHLMAPMRGKDPVLGSNRRLSTWLKWRSSSSDQMSEGLKYWGGLFQLGKVVPPHQMSDTVKKRPAGTSSHFKEHTFWTRVGKLDWFIQVEIL